MNRRIFAAITTAVSIGCCIAPTVQAQTRSVLKVVPQADLKILDPVWTTANVTRSHGYMVYDQLFGVTEAGEIKPQMVETYKSSDGAKNWTFTLRSGLTFHDGTPVKADDAVASIKRWAQRDAFGRLMTDALDSMIAVDAKTFTLKFKTPFPLTLDALSKPSTSALFIMPKRVADTPAEKQIDDYTGSGPYVFVKSEFEPGAKVVYEKFKNYRPRDDVASGTAGGKKVYVDRVEWYIFKDVQTQINALFKGEVDLIELLPAEQFEAVSKNPETKVEMTTPPGPAIALFNHLIPPFNNEKIRQAALMAINQEAILRGQMGHKELYQPCVSIYPCSSPLASKSAAYFTGKPQFDRAKALLKEAGYDGAPVVILQPTDLAAISKFPIVYAQLLRQAGFTVDLQSMDWASVQMRRTSKTAGPTSWNLFVTRVGAGDALNPLVIAYLTGSGEKGFIGWPTDDKIEALKREFSETEDPLKRKAIAEATQLRVYETGLFAPLGETAAPTGMRKSISGVLTAPGNVYWNIRKN